MSELECNCEAECTHGSQAQTFGLRARAHYIGPVCDSCAAHCVRDYIMEMLGWKIIEKREYVQVEISWSGEVLAKLYGQDRLKHARHMLLCIPEDELSNDSLARAAAVEHGFIRSTSI